MKLCLLESYLSPGFARTSDVANCHQVKLSFFMFFWNKERIYKPRYLPWVQIWHAYIISDSLFLLWSSEPIMVKWEFFLSTSVLSLQSKMYIDMCTCVCMWGLMGWNPDRTVQESVFGQQHPNGKPDLVSPAVCRLLQKHQSCLNDLIVGGSLRHYYVLEIASVAMCTAKNSLMSFFNQLVLLCPASITHYAKSKSI